MADVRAFTVERVEAGFTAGRRHAVLVSARGDDVIHLWTDDPALAERLAPGLAVTITVENGRLDDARRG